MKAAVVGGGCAGIAAAWTLLDGGAAVTMYEERAALGGRVRSDQLDGHVLDSGVQLVGSSFDAVFQLLRAAGLADRLERAPGYDAVLRNGRIHSVKYGSIASMLSSGSLSTRLKLRLGAKYLPYLARHARGLDANALHTSGGVRLDNCSAAEFGRREIGDEFVDALVHPLLSAYYGTLADEASAALLHALANAGMDVKVYAARAGAGTLAGELAAALAGRGATLRLETSVTEVSVAGHRARVTVGQDSEEHDAVVLATPAQRARALLRDEPALCAWLEHVRMRPTVTLGLIVQEPLPGEWFGLAFPANAPIAESIAAVCVQDNKHTSGRRSDSDALVVFPSPQLAERLAASTAEHVVATLVPPLESVFPGIAGRIVRARTYRFEDGYTIYYAGYLARLAGLDLNALPARLALAGDYLTGPTIEGAARSGIRAARSLLAG